MGNRPGGRHGHFSVDGKTVKAHRWIYECVVGSIPDGLLMRHRCDFEGCVNPSHLEPGTSKDNTADMFERGRNPDRKGANHPLARITESDVLKIRSLSSCGKTHVDIANQFGLSRQYVGKIIRRENWSHL
jgi:hypothetical protein